MTKERMQHHQTKIKAAAQNLAAASTDDEKAKLQKELDDACEEMLSEAFPEQDDVFSTPEPAFA